MLLPMDEYPYHQITDSFAAVAGSDPQWNDGHYVCCCDDAGTVCLTSNVRLYQNNDVLDGFVCLRHEGRQHNIRVSRRLRPDMDHLGAGPLRLEIVEPMRTVRLVLEDERARHRPRPDCAAARPALHGPGRDHAGRRPAAQRAGHLRGDGRRARAGCSVGGDRIELTPTSRRRSSATTRGATRPGGAARGPTARRSAHRGACPGVRHWVLFHMPDHGGFFFEDPKRPGGLGPAG